MAPPTHRVASGLAILLGLLTFALFAPAVRYGFTDVDDVLYTLETPPVAGGLSTVHVRWAFTTVHESWYSPLTWISLMADSSLFGPRPFGYHLTNVWLHAANAALLAWLLYRLLGHPLAAFLAAALWAFHPLRVESVVWIAERKDVLSGLFFLLATGAYLRFAERPGRLRMLAVGFWMLCGLLSKTSVVVLPPLLLLLDAWPLRRAPFPSSFRGLRTWLPLVREKLPLFALALAGGLLTLFTHRLAHAYAPDFSIPARLALVAPAYWAHLGHVFWPAHLALFYPTTYPSVPVALAAWGALVLLVWGGWRLRRIWPALSIGGAWFLIALLPMIRGIRFDEQSAYPDRYVYLPAIGLALVVAGADLLMARFRRGRIWAIGAICALVAAGGIRTALYLPVWRSPATLAPHLLRAAPDHPLANNVYGKLLAAQSRPAEAVPYFQKAMPWIPREAGANLATAWLHAGRPAEALAAAEELCAAPRPPPDGFLLRGLALLQLDRTAEAIPPLERAAAEMPANPLAWQMLYRAHVEAGDDVAAAKILLRLRGLGNNDIRDFDGLVRTYVRTWRQGNARLAWPFFANNLPRRPDHVLLHNAAAWLLATTDDPPAPPAEAVRLAQIALAAAGQPHPVLLDTLAAAQAAAGDFDAAVRTARQALALLAPGDPETPARQADMERRLAGYRERKPCREFPR
ncbi:MAG: hypothetical protein EOM10_02070 [Opitutae bacterium]|nr:hypothetical protein [Opitutae bacterium]